MAEPLKAFLENKPVEKLKKDPKRLSVERIYQKKTQLEHILLRPDSYIGSVEPVTQQMWVFDEDAGLNCRDVTFVPGLYKIFDEILVNAADNKQRDKGMSCIKVNIDPENNTISVWNNGKGIPVVEHKVEKVYVPALIFGQLLTSSNYDDDEKKVTGGRNGYGAKLCNIFSTKFTVETACKQSKKCFKQTWYDNMGRAGEAGIKPFDGEEYTCITFRPDLAKFKMSILDKDTVALMTRRAYDIAGSAKGVRVFFNSKKLPVTGFRSYVDMYVKDKVDELGGPLTVIHETVNERWEVCLTMSEKGFQQVSFVNSIATTKGGRHIDYVADQVVSKLIEVVKKKNKAGVTVKPFQFVAIAHLGLGTSTSQEAKEYFSDMQRHRIPFKYSGPEDDEAITLAFSKKKVEERKEWLTNFMMNRRQRREHNLPEEYLYGQSTKSLSYNDFVNKELVLFSNSDNERSIPCLVDGLKPGQRKVLYCCFKRNDKREVKVAQLAGSVAEMSAYHHGEVSLMMTIVGLAQNFVGSNNMNLLQPLGQFGTRLHGGKDSASPRYIFTMLSPLARLVFPAVDDNLLKYNYDDNQRVEPEWYIPIIPTVLVNGAEGIGTGWASKIPNYDIREILSNINRMLDGEEPLPMLPNYKDFRGTIEQVMDNQYLNSGEISILDSTTIEISELPVKTWTQAYKENVLEPMLNGTEKVPPLITDYKDYHTDTTVRFVVKMTEEKLREAEAAGLHKVFKLQSPLTCNSMVLFDHVGSLKKYESVQDIIRDFFELRMKYYVLRKDWLAGMLGAESAKLSNQARFILEKIQGTLVIENKPKKELIRMLQKMGYDSDPVKAWKQAQEKNEEEMEEEEEEGEGGEKDNSTGPDYNYLLSMPMWFLTKEKKEELCKQRDAKVTELNTLKKKSPADLWREDLAAFSEELALLMLVFFDKAQPAVKYSMSDSEDEFDDWGKKDAPKRKAVISDDDDASFAPDPSTVSDNDVDSPAPPPKAPEPTKKVAKSKSTVKKTDTKSSSLSDDQEPASKPPTQRKTKEAAPKKPAAAKKPAASKKKAADVKQPSILDALSKPKPASRAPAAKKVPSFDSSDSESEKKAPVTKQKPVLKRKKNLSDDSDSSSSGDLMSRLKSKTTAGTKVSFYTEHSFSFCVTS
ncbi:DNA topoisomerase 2-alpha [Neolamprologus brichardi]|uniref:DNA topoisomerase 2-alpha n=1 Tax=Neolamprologus brichardi TaxID=32507 RepID=UPI001643B467|nr:DNA topoisomerase 2-alpha [Neolamprologus brichardi]